MNSFPASRFEILKIFDLRLFSLQKFFISSPSSFFNPYPIEKHKGSLLRIFFEINEIKEESSPLDRNMPTSTSAM